MSPPPLHISVVIPTMNRADVLLDTLADIAAQQFDGFEVIVIDQSDTPDMRAAEIMAAFPVPARYVHVTHFRGLPEARNVGWRLAQGEIIVYIDDDIRCGPDFLTAHHEAHLRTDAVMVAGGIDELRGDRTAPGGTGSFQPWTITFVRNFHLQDEGYCAHVPGGNFSVRRETLEKTGGFDENLTVGAALYEEGELALRVVRSGGACWFAPEARLTHLAAPMGGCRVGPDVPRYVFGMAHNRAIIIHRHLRPWHRPTAILRMLLYGLSYSRADRSFAPFAAAIRGLRAGRRVAPNVKAEVRP